VRFNFSNFLKEALLKLLALPVVMVAGAIAEVLLGAAASWLGSTRLLCLCAGLLLVVLLIRSRWGLSMVAAARGRLRDPPCFLLLRSESEPDVQDVPGHWETVETDDHGGRTLSWVAGRSYLTNVVNALNRLGCVIAFKPLGWQNPNVRAMVVVTSPTDTEWREDVATLAECCTIVVVPACSPGLLDELRLLSQRGLYRRAVIVMPPEQREDYLNVWYNDDSVTNRDAALAAWRDAAEVLLRDGINLPIADDSQGSAYVPNKDLSARLVRKLPDPSEDEGDTALTSVLAELVATIREPTYTYREAMHKLEFSRAMRRCETSGRVSTRP